MFKRQHIKKLVPPVLVDVLHTFKNKKVEQPLWHGTFESWESARSQAKGYNNETILERVRASVLKVRNGEAVYERDSVLFDKIQYA